MKTKAPIDLTACRALLMGALILAAFGGRPAFSEPQTPTSPPQAASPGQPHQNLGAVAQPSPVVAPVINERNAAYFNRPGAIPLKSFQPVNNAAPIVQGTAAVPASASAPAPPPATPQAAPPPAAQSVLIRPAPIAPRILKERTRPVPGIIVIRPKPAPAAEPRIFPAHGPQPPRQTAGALAPPTASETPDVTAAGLLKAQTAAQSNPSQAAPVRPGTIIAPPPIARLGSIQRQAVAPRPYSQTTGSIPTLAPRPKSLFEPKPKAPADPTAPKTGTACAGALTAC